MRIDSILKIGNQGVEVEDLQQKLIKLKYLSGVADGYFGKNTERAVLNFQNDYNLKVDGIVGPDTWKVIENKIKVLGMDLFQTIKEGGQNDYVIDLKIKLKKLGFYNNEINDYFDKATKESVIQFQKDNKLKADGIVGPDTWKAINEEIKKTLPTIIIPLLEGSKGDEVILLQEYLLLIGYKIEINGDYNQATIEAVKLFQRNNNLNDTGIVNQETWKLIEQQALDLDRIETLKEGSTGEEVIILQEKLKIVKAFYGSVTGSFGPETTEAVKIFQTQNNLPVTGIVDNKTWNVLLDKTNVSFADNVLAVPVIDTFETTSILSRPTLRQGDIGPEVKELQEILTKLMYYEGPINGIFDSATNIAVKTFQTSNKLLSDGIVGRNTWSALVYLYSPLAACGDISESKNISFVGVVIDPAHGGSDPGAVSSQFSEKNLALQISKYMAGRFKELGIPNSLTRDSDVTLSNSERINKIKQPFGDIPNAIVVSNHINAGGGEGAEVIYALRNTPELARDILTEIGKAGQKIRTVYQRTLPSNPNQDYYYIMRDTDNLQVVIVEYGFIDNPVDLAKLNQNWRKYAEATVKAVTEYMGYTYKPATLTSGSYTVKSGDTLYSIARNFNTTVDAIKTANNLTSNILTIGQNLKIPGLEPVIPLEGQTYTVKSGDTLYSIARNFNTTVDAIKTANNLTSNILTIGQNLKILSSEAKTSQESGTYIVKKGDTLYSIASSYNTSVADLKTLNNLSSNLLSIGQTLLVPLYRSFNYQIYTVKEGDNIWSIANNLNILIKTLKENNQLIDNNLYVGQILEIPK